jgi:chromosome segregation ATPase
MEFSKILSEIKGKVLDAAHFDLLRHAYELQDENLKQLKSNNEALRENKEQLKEKISMLEQKIAELKKRIDYYQDQLKNFLAQEYEMSEVANAILNLYLEHDETVLNIKRYYSLMPFSKIQVETGIEELCKSKIGSIRISQTI